MVDSDECDDCDYQTHKNSIWGKDRCLNYMKPISEALPICRASRKAVLDEMSKDRDSDQVKILGVG